MFVKGGSEMKTSLTDGKSVYGEFLKLIAPLIAGNILQQFYNTVGALVVGRYIGGEAFAAVGIASSAMNLFLFAAVGACIGISVVFAQLYGAGELSAFRREHYTALLGGLAIFSAMAILGAALSPLLLRLMQTPTELKEPTLIYLITVLAALPASYVYNFYSALLRSVGKVLVPLGILAMSVAVNLLLALLFIKSLGMGIFGAALSTALAQILSAAASAVYLNCAMPELKYGAADRHFDKALGKKTLSFAGVTALQQTGLYLGKLFVQGAVNTMGTPVISAYTATTRIEGFANSFGDSGASATSVMVAQSFGAEDRERIKKCTSVSFCILGVLGAAASLVLYLAAEPLCEFMLGESGTESCTQAFEYIRTVALFYLLCFTGNSFAGFFDGVGKMSVSMAGSLGHITLRIILSWIFIDRFGLAAVAIATGIGWAAVNVFWLVKYIKRS